MSDFILASGSAARRSLLSNAGYRFRTDPAQVDEPVLKAALKADSVPAAEWARALAHSKGAERSARHSGLFVVAADQTLTVGDDVLTKVSTRAAAHAKIKHLQGRDHTLTSAVCLYRDKTCLWSYQETATLTMRPLDDAQITVYLDQAGDAVLGSVGCYHLEGIGAGLFETIRGDYFTVLGLPLLPLAAALRSYGIGPF